jgi:cell division protein FtsB
MSRQLNSSRLRLVLTGLLCALLLVTIVPRAKTIYELSSRKRELLQEQTRLQEMKVEREQVLATIDTPENMEKIAREQLGMIKPGEKTIVRVLKQ